MTIAKDSVVALHYTLKNDAGDVIDTSEGRDPLHYLHGHGNIVPGLEEALTGKSENDKLDVTVPPEKGYGERDPQRILKIKREQLPPDMEPAPGMMLAMRSPEGYQIPVKITEVAGEEITLDANHELAGATLYFSVTVGSVRPATEEELAHGHVHGPGGAH